ncbi:hypothetical protein PVAP13_5KG384821 [Panicum virgatum]|uniref:Uncharacterized protein n=1 Tax=Panicum virgatum TaxID=38727 RepID=A0A8T0SP31_PANVG|nr:hypothetical protein PVAP13_5KG384821 [Panicum virgatum]
MRSSFRRKGHRLPSDWIAATPTIPPHGPPHRPAAGPPSAPRLPPPHSTAVPPPWSVDPSSPTRAVAPPSRRAVTLRRPRITRRVPRTIAHPSLPAGARSHLGRRSIPCCF